MKRLIWTISLLIISSGAALCLAQTASLEESENDYEIVEFQALPERDAYQEIANLIVEDQISDDDLDAYQFEPEEILAVMYYVGLNEGLSPDILDTWIDDRLSEIDKLKFFEAPLRTGSCYQDVEKANRSGDTFAYNYYLTSSWSCDHDTSDSDWQFQFGPTWYDDPNCVRWYANNWQVRNAFSVAYGSRLQGSDLCSCPITICIGTNGVTLAGGASKVKKYLFISH